MACELDLGQISEELAFHLGVRADLVAVEGGLDNLARSFRFGDAFIKVRKDLPPGVQFSAVARISGVLGPTQTLRLSDGSYALLYKLIEGKNGFERPLQLEHWEQVGHILRQVHNYNGPTSYLEREPFRVDGTEEMTTSPLAAAVAAHRQQIDRIVGEVQLRGKELARKPLEHVLCHADLHVGNIVTASEKVWIVDWDRARLAPRECDLLFFLDGGILGQHGAQEESAFWSGYGRVPVSTEAHRYYQLARILEDLVAFAQDGDEAWFLRQFDSHLLNGIGGP